MYRELRRNATSSWAKGSNSKATPSRISTMVLFHIVKDSFLTTTKTGFAGLTERAL